ncbi:MAG: sigma-70 family RNA polymerase sigma factor [Nannocystaceae bacterium]
MTLRTAHDAARPELDLDEVYRRHARFVWRVAGSLGVAPDERDDVVHDVFLVVHRKASEFDPRRSQTTWLFGITRMVVLNRRRRAGRHARKLRVVPKPPPVPDPEAQDEMRRRVERVRTFLDSLDVRKRVVFELMEIEGMSGPEVAEATGIKVDTIYTRLRSARRAFREFVAGLEHEG